MTGYSTNADAERLLGRRPTGVPFDMPCELGYQCPKCRWSWDERLEWSEYNSFLWCARCNIDYPSALCVDMLAEPDPVWPWRNAGPEDAIQVFLRSVEEAVELAVAARMLEVGCE